jgi:hypothetical protein
MGQYPAQNELAAWAACEGNRVYQLLCYFFSPPLCRALSASSWLRGRSLLWEQELAEQSYPLDAAPRRAPVITLSCLKKWFVWSPPLRREPPLPSGACLGPIEHQSRAVAVQLPMDKQFDLQVVVPRY